MNAERSKQRETRVAQVSGTIDGQGAAGTVGSASLTSEKQETPTITKDYKVAQKRLTK